MGSYLYDSNDERITSLFKCLGILKDTLLRLKKNSSVSFYKETYLTDYELSQTLKISRRTLQDYRNKGVLPYYQICGKILYKESDIRHILERGYNQSIR